MNKRKIIIDTDPGHDDALAIMLLEKSQLFDILAVTTVAGNSNIQDTTNNARYVLDLLKSDSPLFSGAEKPIKRDLILAEVHGEGGLAGADINKQVKLDGKAVDKIIETIKKFPNEVTILTLGPLSNIATAFQKDPSIIPLIPEIVMMGGAIAVPGNKNRVAEFNIYVDPDAADVVFKAKVPKILIPLDACNEVFLTMNDFKKLESSNIYKQIEAMMTHYIAGIRKFENFEGALMYDPLAAYYLINPQSFEMQMMDIQIETQSDLTRGMTVSDRRNWGKKKPNINVAVKANKESFVKDFIATLKKD